MGKVNAQLLTEKSETVLRCLQRVRQKKPAQLGQLLTDIDAQDIIVLNLERAVQACVDVAAHIVAHTALPAASTMADSFLSLQHAGILDENLARRMVKAVGLRNLLVHQYKAIDWNIVWAVLEKHLDDPVAFIAAVQKWTSGS